MTEAEYLTTEEVADLLRTTAETVRYWRHVGKGPKSFKIGRRAPYAREDVEALLATSRALPQSADTGPVATTTPGSIVCPHCGHGIEITVQEVQ